MKSHAEPRKTKEIDPEAELRRVIDEVKAKRQRVYDLVDEHAFEAAQLTVDAMKFYGEDDYDFRSMNVRMDAADRVLDLAGYKIKRNEHTGKDGTPLVVNITQNQAERVVEASKA